MKFKRKNSNNSNGVCVRDISMMGFGALVSITLMITVQIQQSMQERSGILDLNSLDEVGKSVQVEDRSSGWHPIHVFYGKMNHLTDEIPEKWWVKDSPRHKNGKEWYGQHGQDVAIAKVFDFKKDGFFVDLAANDAIWASNTFMMEHHFGWKGICIEANPYYWYRLSFRKCHAVGSIVGQTDFEELEVKLNFDKGSGPFSGITGKQFDNKKNDKAVKRYGASLKTILEKFNAPKIIDYLSLDVEGAETYIMKEFAWDEYTFLAMTVERPPEELQALFTNNGYKKVLDIKRGDTLWVHESIYETAKENLAKNPDEINAHVVKDFPEAF